MKILFLILISFPLFAQEVIDPQVHTKKEKSFPGETPPKESPVEKVVEDAKPLPAQEPEMVKECGVIKSHTQRMRKKSFGTVMVGYEFLAMWIPSKKTISYTQIFNQDWSAELEYSWASLGLPPLIGIDIGKISEKRFSLLARKYTGNSFHFMFGPYYNHIRGDLGGDILYGMVDTSVASFESDHVGASLGMGNRWQLSNGITLGIYWIRANIPLIETKNDHDVVRNIVDEKDSEDIKKISRIVNRYPNFVLFGLSLGYTF